MVAARLPQQWHAVHTRYAKEQRFYGAGANGSGGTTTSNFLAGMVKSLPPLHDVAAMAGLDLPKYLGDMKPAELPATTNGQGK